MINYKYMKMEKIKLHIIRSFSELNKWFGINESILNFTPSNEDWNIRKVLEHVVLCNAHLLYTFYAANDRNEIHSDEKQNIIGVRGNFAWPHISRIKPEGRLEIRLLKQQLQEQFAESLQLLGRIEKEDAHKISERGKSRAAQGLLFLSLHIERHIRQMESIEKKYFENLNSDRDAA